jgi:hypothetical protein
MQWNYLQTSEFPYPFDRLRSEPFQTSISDHVASTAKALDVVRFIVQRIAVSMVSIERRLATLFTFAERLAARSAIAALMWNRARKPVPLMV